VCRCGRPTFQSLHLGHFTESTRFLPRRVSDGLQRLSRLPNWSWRIRAAVSDTFPECTGSKATYINPLTIYLWAIVFRFLQPSILVARMFAAFWMFAPCLLLGVLATRISGRRKIGILVAVTPLVRPWLFEIGQLVWDAHFSAFTVVLFLLAAYRIQSKERWNWQGIAMGAGSLAVITYGYFSGRVLAPAFALGLLFFAATKQRVLGVLNIWLAYAVTLVPLVLFNRSHSGVLTKRLWEVTYIRTDVPWNKSHFSLLSLSGATCRTRV